MSKEVKLHLGCGTVYLENYINIDAVGELAKDRPDLVEHNKTTIKNYYKFPFRENKDNKVCDMHMDVTDLSYFEDESVDEILNVNLVDHMKKEKFLETLIEWKRVLKPRGRLIIDVDDRQKQAKILVDAKTFEEIEWGMRLIYCHHRNEFDTHWWGYTPDYMKILLEQNDWKVLWVRDDYIIHDMYPNFQICATKK